MSHPDLKEKLAPRIQLMRDIDERVSRGESDFAVAADIFEELATSTLFADYISDRLAGLLFDSDHMISSETISGVSKNNIWVYAGNALQIALTLYRDKKKHLHFFSADSAFAVVGEQDVSADFYQVTPTPTNAPLTQNNVLVPLSSARYGKGQTFRRLGRDQVCDLYTTHGSPALVARMVGRPKGAMEWLFDRSQTPHRPWTSSTISPSSSHVSSVANLAGALGQPEFLDTLVHVAKQHPDHAARWTALQNAARIDKSVGISLLREAVSDPHPHVRNAARLTLERNRLDQGVPA